MSLTLKRSERNTVSTRSSKELKEYNAAINYLLSQPEKRTPKNLIILGDKLDALEKLGGSEKELRFEDFKKAHEPPPIDTPEKIAKFFEGRVAGPYEFLPAKKGGG